MAGNLSVVEALTISDFEINPGVVPPYLVIQSGSTTYSLFYHYFCSSAVTVMPLIKEENPAIWQLRMMVVACVASICDTSNKATTGNTTNRVHPQ